MLRFMRWLAKVLGWTIVVIFLFAVLGAMLLA